MPAVYTFNPKVVKGSIGAYPELQRPIEFTPGSLLTVCAPAACRSQMVFRTAMRRCTA